MAYGWTWTPVGEVRGDGGSDFEEPRGVSAALWTGTQGDARAVLLSGLFCVRGRPGHHCCGIGRTSSQRKFGVCWSAGEVRSAQLDVEASRVDITTNRNSWHLGDRSPKKSYDPASMKEGHTKPAWPACTREKATAKRSSISGLFRAAPDHLRTKAGRSAISPSPPAHPRQRLAGSQTACAGDQPKPLSQDAACGGILLAVHCLPSFLLSWLEKPSPPAPFHRASFRIFARISPLYSGYFGLNRALLRQKTLPAKLPPAAPFSTSRGYRPWCLFSVCLSWVGSAGAARPVAWAFPRPIPPLFPGYSAQKRPKKNRPLHPQLPLRRRPRSFTFSGKPAFPLADPIHALNPRRNLRSCLSALT